MHYVLLGEHSPEICPTSNSRTRQLLLDTAADIPKIAEKCGVSILSGPWVNRQHTTVVVVEAGSSEDLDRFLVESRLPQWNSVRILPSLHLQEGIQDVQTSASLF
ncbi:MAG TPA: hypothetical protein VFA11_08865 [Acidimicrobiales bacterium]|nr:hypothetical protein [Acidimicrobiales bacterium]